MGQLACPAYSSLEGMQFSHTEIRMSVFATLKKFVRSGPGAQVLLGVALAASVSWASCAEARHNADAAVWQYQIEQVQEYVTGANARVESAEAAADSLQHVSDSLTAAAAVQAPALRERIVTVRDSTPVELASHPAVVVRDSIIDAQQGTIVTLQTALAVEREASDSVRAALRYATSARDSLLVVLDARVSEKPWYVPTFGVGPSAGVTFGGKPYFGAGAHLQWEISF